MVSIATRDIKYANRFFRKFYHMVDEPNFLDNILKADNKSELQDILIKEVS